METPLDAARERQLLALAAFVVLLSMAALAVIPAARAADWQAGAVRWPLIAAACGWVVLAVVAHVVLRRALPGHDPLLLPAALLLSGWGVALIWRLLPDFGMRQALWLAVSVAAMLVVTYPPHLLRWLRRFRYVWLTLGLALTAATLLLGVNPSGFGPRLWLGAGGVYFQPAVLLKLLLVAFMAAYLAEKRDLIHSPREVAGQRLPDLQYLGPLLAMWGFSLVLLFFQRDLGAGSLLLAVFLAMLYLASGQVWYVVLGLGLIVIGGAGLYAVFDVVQVRVDAWLNPWADAAGDSYQIVQSLIALASGGVLGRGFGLGSPGVVPVVHSDFMFSAIAEEWGLAGMLAVIALVGVVVQRGLRIAALARSRYATLLAAGLATLLALQTVFIVGGVTRALPLTGITLPFLSYGGSALLINFVIVGLLLRLSHEVEHGRA